MPLAIRLMIGCAFVLASAAGPAPAQQAARAKAGELAAPAAPRTEAAEPEPGDAEDLRAQIRRLKQIARGGEIQNGTLKPSMGGGMLGLLLEFDSLRDELKLSDSQEKKIRQMASQTDERRKTIKEEMKLKKREFKAMGLEYEKTAKVDAYILLHQENESALNSVLKPRQKERLEQVRLRILGPSALADPVVASKAGLGEDQRAQIEGVLAQLRETEKQLVEGFRLPPPKVVTQPQHSSPAKDRSRSPKTASESRTQILKLGDDRESVQKRADDRIAKVLQARQRKTFNEMLGPPFDLSTLFKIKDPKPSADAEIASESAPAKASSAREAAKK